MPSKKGQKKLGRPTRYTPEYADLICERIATNPIGDHKLCEMYDDMPNHSTLYEWRYKYPDFSVKYLSAKGQQSMLLVEEIDDLLNHEVIYNIDEKGQKRIDPPSASMAIARCNNRKWQAARLAPRVYGDQKQIEQLQEKNNDLLEECKRLKEELDRKNMKEC